MLSFETAKQLADKTLAEGQAHNAPALTVAVLDAGGHTVVLYRQSGAGIVRAEIAIGKAWGALGLGFNSRNIAEVAQRLPTFFDALAVASAGRVIPAPGGVLLRTPAEGIIGAIGVTGGEPDDDEAYAIAAANAVGLQPEPSTPTRH